MPPSTRSQTASREQQEREAIATSDAPPKLALPSFNPHVDLSKNTGAWASGVRMRQETSKQFGSQAESTFENGTNVQSRASSNSRKARRRRDDSPDEPPRFTINLSLPPEQRYLAVCHAFQSEIAELVPLFDEVVGGMLSCVPLKWLHLICKLGLRGVYDQEENAELKGISEATGVKMYLLVAFNVLLDLFMGCSSGGAAIRGGSGSKMLHFRTLDWGMPSLRRVVVQLHFVTEENGPVLASSITYAGYVGVLTGVREGLSMSLNFRPNRVDNGVFWADAKYVWHLVCVLLGRRRSISSTLRGFLLPQCPKRGWLPFEKAIKGQNENILDYAGVVEQIGGNYQNQKRPITTTACYLCFSNGRETTVIEKDRISARTRSGDEFIVVTNTDESPPTTPTAIPSQSSTEKPDGASSSPALTPAQRDPALEELLTEAKDRQDCALDNWRNLQSSRVREKGLQHITAEQRKQLADEKDVVQLTQRYPTTNECTHFACVMDPAQGSVVWCRRWKEPVAGEWVRGHMSGAW